MFEKYTCTVEGVASLQPFFVSVPFSLPTNDIKGVDGGKINVRAVLGLICWNDLKTLFSTKAVLLASTR